MDCSILQELADFDTHAPIDIAVSFEDSDEFDDIKTENIPNNDNAKNTKQPPDVANKVKTEIKEYPKSISEISDEVKVDKQTGKDICNETDTCLVQSGENTQKSDVSRKRKQMQLQIYKNKKKPSQSSMNENRPNNQSSHILENTCTFEINNSSNDHPRAEIARPNRHSPLDIDPKRNSPETKSSENKLRSYIQKCLVPVSEHMRLIIEAYYYHRHHNVSESSFTLMKNKLFNLSYSTVVSILVPEEKNIAFLRKFLTDTYRRACETPSVYKSTYEDYVILLKELLKWTKDNKSIIEKATSLQRNNVQKLKTPDCNNLEFNKAPEQNPLTSNIEHEVKESPKNVDQNNICIFSAGTNAHKINISVDSSLKKYIHNTCSNNSLDIGTAVEQQQCKITDQTVTRVQSELVKQLTKCPQTYSRKHKQEQPIDWPLIIHNVPVVESTRQMNFSQQMRTGVTQMQRPPEIQQGQKSVQPHYSHKSEQQLPGSNFQCANQIKAPQQMHAGLRPPKMQQAQKSLQETHQLVSHYRHTSENLPQYKQPTRVSSQCVPTHHVHSSQLHQQRVQTSIRQVPELPQYGQQQQYHNPPPYDQTQRQFEQQQHVLSQRLQPQNVPPQMCPQYGTHISPYFGQTQPSLQQYGHIHVPNGQPRNVLPRRAPKQLQCGNALPAVPTEGPQQSNMLQHQAHTPIGGSPRSVSTDSGFISPLNFVASDQTIPPSNQNTDATSLLITHVTSLNPQVAFIDEGKCVVCKTPTKQMCMGCMVLYYCSYECQLTDWSNHEPNCKANK